MDRRTIGQTDGLTNCRRTYLSDEDDDEAVVALIVVESVDERGERLRQVRVSLAPDRRYADHHRHCRHNTQTQLQLRDEKRQIRASYI